MWPSGLYWLGLLLSQVGRFLIPEYTRLQMMQEELERLQSSMAA